MSGGGFRMEKIKEVIDRMGEETSQALTRLRADMNAGFEEQKQANSEMRAALGSMDRAISRQQHHLDEGMAGMDEMFQRHRESMGTVLFTYVEDVHGIKAAVRHLEQDRTAILRRLDVLERNQAS